MANDEQFMRKALELARSGIALVSPNPAVGAVVVNSAGREVGSGSHRYDEIKHAEVIALAQAGEAAVGSTLYLNLEPCSHQGRTGPCADAVIASGIKHVVCAMEDPNPEVAGRGFAKLCAAGVTVNIGLFEKEAKKLNHTFAKFIRTRKPLVTLKSAMSLDGKIARENKWLPTNPSDSSRSHDGHDDDGHDDDGHDDDGHDDDGHDDGGHDDDRWITGKSARAYVQQLRHQSDAILVGVGTVLADDPLLTDRSGLPRRRKLLRVILDSSLRTPVNSQIVQGTDNDVVVFCCSCDSAARSKLESKGVRIFKVPCGTDNRPAFSTVIAALGEMQVTSLLVEGGASVNGAALGSGEVDRLVLFYAPKIYGAEAIPFLSEAGAALNSTSLRLTEMELHRFGDDFAVEAYLRDPYAHQD